VEIASGSAIPREILNGNNAMRETEVGGWMERSSPRASARAVRLGAISSGIVLGLTLVMTAGAARAGDDDDRSFTERFVDGFKATIRGNNMDNRGIDYRERSPLVVPPNLDLPPPVADAGPAKIANWPKDPDERQRKAIIAAKKKNAPPVAAAAPQPAQAPAQANAAAPVGVTGAPPAVIAAGASEPPPPPREGTAKYDPALDQGGNIVRDGAGTIGSTLGIGDTFGLGSLFGGKSHDSAPFTNEPTREALTQPPEGYQTPSSGYAYGVAPKGFLDGQSNPDRNPNAAKSSASSVVH
jgi:hypothetical protein